ncbi:unnamed protein product [Colias eurytheme]|nr:unnamed protein product [Colias eurytheme]
MRLTAEHTGRSESERLGAGARRIRAPRNHSRHEPSEESDGASSYESDLPVARIEERQSSVWWRRQADHATGDSRAQHRLTCHSGSAVLPHRTDHYPGASTTHVTQSAPAPPGIATRGTPLGTRSTRDCRSALDASPPGPDPPPRPSPRDPRPAPPAPAHTIRHSPLLQLTVSRDYYINIKHRPSIFKF